MIPGSKEWAQVSQKYPIHWDCSLERAVDIGQTRLILPGKNYIAEITSYYESLEIPGMLISEGRSPLGLSKALEGQ